MLLSTHVILHRATTHDVVEIARMNITNDGTSHGKSRGNYICETFVGDEDGRMEKIVDHARVTNYARQALPVWYLITAALHALGYVVPKDTTIASDSPKKNRATK